MCVCCRGGAGGGVAGLQPGSQKAWLVLRPFLRSHQFSSLVQVLGFEDCCVVF